MALIANIDNAGYHTAGVFKASGVVIKSLVPNKVKASMCKQSLSLSLKDNVWTLNRGSITHSRIDRVQSFLFKF